MPLPDLRCETISGAKDTASSNVTLFLFPFKFFTEEPLEVVIIELLPTATFSAASLPDLGVGGYRPLPTLEFPMELTGLSSLIRGLDNKS